VLNHPRSGCSSAFQSYSWPKQPFLQDFSKLDTSPVSCTTASPNLKDGWNLPVIKPESQLAWAAASPTPSIFFLSINWLSASFIPWLPATITGRCCFWLLTLREGRGHGVQGSVCVVVGGGQEQEQRNLIKARHVVKGFTLKIVFIDHIYR
jgi:hypothetical protein